MNRSLYPAVSTIALLAGVACTARGAPTPAAPDAGLVAHWTFDEGQGAVARDVTGHGHDAALTQVAWVRSPRGFAARFDSKQSRAVYGKPQTMNLSGDTTLALWVRTDASVAPATTRLLFGDTGGTIQRNLNLRLDTGGLRFEWATGVRADWITAPGALLNNTWKHVVVVADAAQQLVVLYIDGVVVVRSKSDLPISSVPVQERLTGWFFNGFFQGDLDDIRLYRRALSSAEVERLFAAQADVQVSAPTVLLDASRPELRGVATIRVRNWSKQSRAVALSGAHVKPQEALLAPGAETELRLGEVGLTRVWRGRTDLLICEPLQESGRAVLTVRAGDTVEAMPLGPAAAELVFEPLQAQVHDPWQRQLAPGKTETVRCDLRLAIPAEQLRQGSARVRLVSRETGRETLSQRIDAPRAAQLLTLDVRGLPWGAYDMTIGFHDRAGREVVSAKRLATILPGGKQQLRVLNNLATELLDARPRGLLAERRLEFMNPRDGWVWFRAAGACALHLGEKPLLAAEKGRPALEAMRLLPAGKHTLCVAGTPDAVTVRAIPALFYNVYPSGSLIRPFGANTWERLRKYTLPNVNVIESHLVDTPEREEWIGQGKQWLAFIQAPGLRGAEPWTVEEMRDVWLKAGGTSAAHGAQRGLDLAKLSGVQVDEYFQGGTWDSAQGQRNLVTTTLSVAALAEEPAFRGKIWVPFMVRMWSSPAAQLLMKTTLGSGWPFSEEVYVGEMPTEAEDAAEIRSRFLRVAQCLEDTYPGSVRRMIFTPMYAYLPYCTSNRCAQADFRVHLDMQMHLLANDPAFFGLGGVQPYRSNYVDEEILNCMGRLLRHYCIDGQTRPMLSDPYELRHLRNPDFAAGLQHWQVSAAEPGTVTPGKFSGYGNIEGRYPRGTLGESFACLKRSAKAPNRLSQPLEGLQPGRLYSIKLISGDLADLKGGRSQYTKHTLDVRVAGATLDGPGFSWPFPGAPQGPQFTQQKPFWMTFHWLRFRATAPTARLTISDWKAPQQPGAPVGQELAINFVEVQPVLED
jgi:hypothetical protein